MTARKWVVAHRGDHSQAPENTVAAFDAAIHAGADMIEFDVHRLPGGTLVVCHDEPSAGADVPRLADVLRLCAGRIRLDIELKNFTCEDDVLAALAEAGVDPDDCIVTSFDAAQLARIRRAHPALRTGLLTEGLPERCEDAFLAPHYANLTIERLAEYEARGIPLLPWTVNGNADLERLLAAPAVAGVITDRVREALEARGRLK